MPGQTLTKRIQAVRSKKSLARILGLTSAELSDLLVSLDNGDCYKERAKPKKNGGVRRISIPTKRLKAVQKVIGRAISPLSASPIAYCSVSGRSHVTGAEQHTGAEAVAVFDIQDFYPSISHRRVYQALMHEFGAASEVSRVLTRLTTWKGSLPQGSPASPSIANLIMMDFDNELEALCAANDCRPVRIMDDISISGSPHSVRCSLDQSIRLVHRYGFKVRRDKTSVLGRSRGIVVTGLIVDNKVSVPKRERGKNLSRSAIRSQVRAILKRPKKHSLRELRSLNGKISYIATCNPSFSRSKEVVRLRELLLLREREEVLRSTQ